ncbi:hypothetical protein Pelo_2026 [Pelomyxa schiedti]|nr:hypothetical protein Pelo_2026 [Pelomyxa schiedti]
MEHLRNCGPTARPTVVKQLLSMDVVTAIRMHFHKNFEAHEILSCLEESGGDLLTCMSRLNQKISDTERHLKLHSCL